MTKRKRNEVLEKQYYDQGSCCIYCKEKVPYELITRDHFQPLSKGNTFLKNKVFACRYCNSMKGSLNINEFVNDLYIRINKEISILKNKNLNQFDLIQKKLII